MPAPVTPPATLDLLTPGARVIVRDLDWQVEQVERQAMGTRAIVRCTCRSELVRGQSAAFFSDLDEIVPEDPTRTQFVLDRSPQGITTRLAIEALARRTPLAVANTKVMVGHRMLADEPAIPARAVPEGERAASASSASSGRRS